MATADQYAEWIVANQAKKGSPEFETVAAAYKQARSESADQPAPTSAPLKMGREGFEDTLRQEMQGMPWGERNKYGLALSLSRGLQGIKGLAAGSEINQGLRRIGLPNISSTPNQDVLQASNVASQEAPVGSAIGEIIKYAPAAALSPLAAVGAAATMGAAYEPGTTGERVTAGAKEGAFAAGAGLAAKGIGWTAKKIAGANAIDRARKVLQEIIGEKDIPKAVQLARGAKGQDVNSVQALEELKNPTLAALDDTILSSKNEAMTSEIAKEYTDRAARQKAARVAEMEGMAGGGSRESTAISRDFKMKQLERELGPERVLALRQASEAGELIPNMLAKLGERERMYVSALREGMPSGQPIRTTTATTSAAGTGPGVPVTGQAAIHPSTEAAQSSVRNAEGAHGWISNADRAQEWKAASRDLGQIAGQRRQEADLIRSQIKSLEDEGLKPLTIAPAIDSIERRLASPVTQMNTDKTAVLDAVLKKLRIAGNDPHAIAELRSQGVNQLIGDLIQNGKVSKVGAAKALGEVKKGLDKAIIDAGGEGWLTKYMRPYETGFAEKNALKLADDLRVMLDANPDGFIKAVRGEMPELVEKYSATAKSMAEILGPERFDKIRGIARELSRDESIKELTKSGQGSLANVLKQDFMTTHLPAFLNRWMMLANVAIKKGELYVNKAMLDNIEGAMRDPEKLAKLIEMSPPEKRSIMLKMIDDVAKSGVPAATGAAVGSAVPQQPLKD